MPETQVQHARGTGADFASYTGPAGEICVNTDDWSLRVQDGVTVGGWPVGGKLPNFVEALALEKLGGI